MRRTKKPTQEENRGTKMSKKGSCELCSNPARMFCESDQASLCWDCDDKVHSANFLVAKHSRTLLCHVCYSPTAWKASGLKLGTSISVCHACAEIGLNPAAPIERGQDVCDNSQESESDDGEYNSDTDTDYSEEEEDDGENQVVPWDEAPAAAATTSSTAAIASTSEGDEGEEASASLKRMRENPFDSEELISDRDEDDGCCSSQNSDSKLRETASDRVTSFQSQSDDNNGTSSSSSRLLRPLKMRRRRNNSDDGPSVSPEQPEMKSLKGTAAIVDKLKRLQQEIVTEEEEASTMILGICKLTRDA